MGIYDRDYLQDRPGGFGALLAGGSTVKTLILINVAVFLLGWIGGPPMQAFYQEFLAARSDAIFKQFQIWQLLTYAFVHFELFHILWNMLFLFFVGRELEGIYGPREFLRMYLTAAVVAGLCWAILDQAKGGGQVPMLGASGAVAAALFIYVLYYPHREILLFFILPVPMWLFAIIFFGRDLLGLLQSFQGLDTRPVAFAAHLSGAAYGLLYKKYDLRWSRLLAGWGWNRRPRLRVFSPEPRRRKPSRTGAATPSRSEAGARAAPSGIFPDEHLDAKLDEILAKIAREGRSGLTEEENRILQEASERARNRRGERLR